MSLGSGSKARGPKIKILLHKPKALARPSLIFQFPKITFRDKSSFFFLAKDRLIVTKKYVLNFDDLVLHNEFISALDRG